LVLPFRATSISFVKPFSFFGDIESIACGVGHNPDSFPPVRRPKISSPKDEGSANGVTKSPQVSDDHGQVLAYSWHVFKQNESRPDNPNNVCCRWPHVSFVINSFSLSGDAEGLTGKSCGNDINHSRIACGVPVTDECFDIAEDRGGGEDSVTDSGGKDSLAVVIPLDIPDGSETKEHRSKKSTACT